MLEEGGETDWWSGLWLPACPLTVLCDPDQNSAVILSTSGWEPPSPDPALPQEEGTEEEGMAGGLLTAGPQESTPFSSVTVAFTQKGWRQLAPTPRDRFKEGMPEKSRNLVLLDWKIVSESPPEQDISEESFQDPSVEMPSGESDHRNSELGKSFNLRPVLSPQQRVPTEVRPLVKALQKR
eukprot:bmy_04058T0